MDDKLKCIICKKDFDKLQVIKEKLNSLPRIVDNKAICGRCTEKGWTFCEICKKPYNKNEVNFNSFFIYDDIADVPQKFYKLVSLLLKEDSLLSHSIEKDNFCCNRDYNLEYWSTNIQDYVSLLLVENIEFDNMNIHFIDRFSKEELNELAEYIENKMKYIEKNL